MNVDDRVWLRHMLDAAKEAIAFAQGETREALDEDRKLLLAIIKSIEIIGEAAARVSESCKATHSQIPWPQIVGMRNRLIHAYFDIDLDRVWDTVIDDIPTLVEQLEAILPPGEKEGNSK